MLGRVVNSLPFWLSQRITKFYFQVLTRNQQGFHSATELHNYSSMDVNVLSALQDNYMYLIVCKATKQAAVVDPVEPQKVLECVEKQGAVLTSVLTTHHHWDHAGGNQELLRLHPGLEVYGGDNRIEAMTKKVEHKTKFNVGNLTVECLTTPCHTVGHICYSVTPPDNEVAVFTGDTLFLGGCGRFFEGTAENMDKALNEILGKLPGKMKVYCGHEYSMQNLKFAQLVEPDNEEIKKKIAWVEQRRKDGLPTVPSTIDEEKSYNPFMRVRQPSVMKHTKTSEPIETMRSLRLEKDNFKG